MTDAFVHYDARSDKRRIFLDPVEVIGDTPGLNSCPDVAGHCFNACCHLFHFVRSYPTLIGKQYDGSISRWG